MKTPLRANEGMRLSVLHSKRGISLITVLQGRAIDPPVRKVAAVLRKTDMHNHKSPLRKRQNSAAVKNMKNRIDSPRRVW